MSAAAPIDYDTLAAQHGGSTAVDYDALAAQHGGTASSAPVPPKAALQPYDASKFGRFTSEENYPKWAATSPEAGPLTKPGEYEAWTGAHLSPSDTLKVSAQAPALGLATVAPLMTGGMSLPIQAAVGGLSGAAQAKLEGGSDKAAAASGAIGAALPVAGHYISEAMDPIARKLYQSALKPSTTIPAAKVGQMVQTGLQESIPVSENGVRNLSSLIDDTNQKIKDVIASDPTKSVNKFAVASRLSDTAKRFANQVNPTADLNAVSGAGNEFLETQPGQIPAQDAQALKQGTYQQLSSKAYGEMQTAAVESQKALARGLKEEIANQFPELTELNARDSKLYDLEGPLTKAVQRISNHQVIGIGTPIAASAGAAITSSAKVGVISGLLKAVLDDPVVKSRLAIALSKGGQGLPMSWVTGQIAAFSDSLAHASQSSDQSPSDHTSGRGQQ